MTHFSDGVSVGGAYTNPIVGSTGGFGIDVGQSVTLEIVPLTKSATNLATSQTLAAAGNLALTAGTGITVVSVNGVTRYVFDVTRCVTITSAGVDTGITFTVSGFDFYGAALTSTVTGTSGSVATTKKAFASVTKITASGATASTVTAGTADTFGMPVAVLDKGYVGSIGWANSLGFDAGTFTAADTTSPATAATGDVRGTYVPSSSSDGTKRLIVDIVASIAQQNPAQSASAAIAILGVTQA
jgi:hypothetical protein